MLARPLHSEHRPPQSHDETFLIDGPQLIWHNMTVFGPGDDPRSTLRQRLRRNGHRSARSTTGSLPCCSNRAASRSKVTRAWAPSARPSNAITPSAKSPPAASNLSPASTQSPRPRPYTLRSTQISSHSIHGCSACNCNSPPGHTSTSRRCPGRSCPLAVTVREVVIHPGTDQLFQGKADLPFWRPLKPPEVAADAVQAPA